MNITIIAQTEYNTSAGFAYQYGQDSDHTFYRRMVSEKGRLLKGCGWIRYDMTPSRINHLEHLLKRECVQEELELAAEQRFDR